MYKNACLLKKFQRRSIVKTRRDLPEWFQKECSKTICHLISELPKYQEASRIAIYRAFNGEVSLDLLWHDAIAANKICYFPVLDANQCMKFVSANTSTAFQKNRFGILEPIGNSDTSPIDIYFLPLVGFDSHGHRLGTGGGYYDRTFANIKSPFSIGIGYAFQQLKIIQTDLTDYPLDLVITEHGILHPFHKAHS
jgi:5-formyltetrahydrofolate cyclo-ligase